MGKRELRRKATNRNSAHLITDVTLDDCANNPRKTNLLGKAKLSLKVISAPIEGDENTVDDDQEDSTPDKLKLSKTDSSPPKVNNLSGVTYPPDLWFLIARYISPEELLNFSLICKDAYRVLLSAQFWKHMYKRLTNDETQLPRSLHNPCDSRLGLRSRVIRLFFIRCPALVQRIKPPLAPRYEPYSLQGMQLVLAWHEKEGGHWNYWFKWTRRRTGHEISFKHLDSELFDNPESGCRVLKAVCTEFIGFTYPQHSYLSAVSLSLTSDMRGQKLSLGFSDYTTTHCAARMKQSLGRAGLVQQRIDIEPVTRCVLMDWWHPEYPYPNESLFPSNRPCLEEDW